MVCGGGWGQFSDGDGGRVVVKVGYGVDIGESKTLLGGLAVCGINVEQFGVNSNRNMGKGNVKTPNRTPPK